MNHRRMGTSRPHPTLIVGTAGDYPAQNLDRKQEVVGRPTSIESGAARPLMSQSHFARPTQHSPSGNAHCPTSLSA